MATTALGFPYPLGTDRVMDGDDAIRALAEAVDSKLGVTAAGAGVIVGTGAATAQVVVTLPAGRFVAAPSAVVANFKDGSTHILFTATYTATTFTAIARRYDSAVFSGNVNFVWLARS